MKIEYVVTNLCTDKMSRTDNTREIFQLMKKQDDILEEVDSIELRERKELARNHHAHRNDLSKNYESKLKDLRKNHLEVYGSRCRTTTKLRHEKCDKFEFVFSIGKHHSSYKEDRAWNKLLDCIEKGDPSGLLEELKEEELKDNSGYHTGDYIQGDAHFIPRPELDRQFYSSDEVVVRIPKGKYTLPKLISMTDKIIYALREFMREIDSDVPNNINGRLQINVKQYTS